MNQSLSDLKLRSFNGINLLQNYEICRQQSPCYLLIPPPRLPIFPKLVLANPSSTSINLRQHTDLFFIILGIFIALISTCFILFLLAIKLRQYHRRLKDKHVSNSSASFSNILPTSYNSLTPLTTITTNRSPLLTIPDNLQQHLHSDDRSSYHNHPTNIYEEIRISLEHHDNSCALAYHQQKPSISSTAHHLTPYYYTCEVSPSKIICQNCLLETLHRKQQCLCRNFFVPIK